MPRRAGTPPRRAPRTTTPRGATTHTRPAGHLRCGRRSPGHRLKVTMPPTQVALGTPKHDGEIGYPLSLSLGRSYGHSEPATDSATDSAAVSASRSTAGDRAVGLVAPARHHSSPYGVARPGGFVLSRTVIGPDADVAGVGGGSRDRVIHRAPVADGYRLVCRAFSTGERLSVRWRRDASRTVLANMTGLADTVADSRSPIPSRRFQAAADS